MKFISFDQKFYSMTGKGAKQGIYFRRQKLLDFKISCIGNFHCWS